jgi:hypothetical protein
MTNERPEIVEKERVVAENKLSSLNKLFDVNISVFDSYSSLLERRPNGEDNFEKLLDLSQAKGRVLLSGRGASGKSTTWSASHNGRGLRLCGFLTASTGLQRRCTPCRAPFSAFSAAHFWPLAYSTRTPPLAAAHGAAMRSLARFMFIAIATN